MGRGQSIRVAMVKFTEQGTSYPVRCDDRAFGVGSKVDVSMWEGTPKAALLDGEITEITFSRYPPLGHVVSAAGGSGTFDLPGLV
jgi:hypothetical protein